jgi:hypothetical protein
MNLSNFKLGIYDLLGLVVPGMILVCEGGVTLRGWVNFCTALNHMSGTSFTLLLVFSFVLGHFVQELADVSIKKIKGPRFFAAGRDEVWASPEAQAIKSAVWTESGVTLGSVDATFDYCLTRLGDRFPKRDTLLATADLSRSFLVLVLFAVPAATRITWDINHRLLIFLPLLLCCLAALVLTGLLAWRRMVRFRRMSETGVFRAYLGSRPFANAQEGVPEKVP